MRCSADFVLHRVYIGSRRLEGLAGDRRVAGSYLIKSFYGLGERNRQMWRVLQSLTGN